jgi:hypothetical protein
MSTLRHKNIQQLINLGLVHTFIETGTYRGDTTAWASKHFAQVHSIELGETLYDHCVARFADRDNVHLIHGDSVKSLQRLLPTVNDRIMFWLDAHYSSRDTAKGEVSVPLLDELQVIASHPIKDHVILIDDYRLFGWKNASGEEDWTTITGKNVGQILRSINPKYRLFDASLAGRALSTTSSGCRGASWLSA